MDSYFEQYEVRITDRVFDESVIQENNVPKFPKDAAVKNWLSSKSIQPIQTTIPAGGTDAGEKSIIEAIKGNPVLFDSTTNTPKAGKFIIASNDASFFSVGKGGEAFVAQTKNAQILTKEGAINFEHSTAV